MPTTQDRGINGRRNLASNYTGDCSLCTNKYSYTYVVSPFLRLSSLLFSDANKGRSRAFKRQSGANHIIRGLKTASPAPNKAIKDTVPCSIK